MKSQLLNALASLLLALACLSCRQVTAPGSSGAEASPSALAVVAGNEISEEALRAELRRRFRIAPEGGLTLEHKLEALERLILNEAIYAQAQASGFDQAPETQARIKNLVIAQFREKRFTNATPAVSETEVEAACQAQPERFTQPSAVRGAAIFLEVPRLATAEKKAEIRQRAAAMLEEAEAAADERAFAQLVARHSQNQASRYRGGDTGWMTQGATDVEPALVEALMALGQPGQFAPVVETPHGLYVVRLLEKREAGRKPLAEIKAAVRYRLAQQKTAQAERDFMAAMKAGLDIQIHRTRLDSISLPATPEPPPLPGAVTAQK